MNTEIGFNTKLLHGKTSSGFANREILPPVSQVTAFQYKSCVKDLCRILIKQKHKGNKTQIFLSYNAKHQMKQITVWRMLKSQAPAKQ